MGEVTALFGGALVAAWAALEPVREALELADTSASLRDRLRDRRFTRDVVKNARQALDNSDGIDKKAARKLLGEEVFVAFAADPEDASLRAALSDHVRQAGGLGGLVGPGCDENSVFTELAAAFVAATFDACMSPAQRLLAARLDVADETALHILNTALDLHPKIDRLLEIVDSQPEVAEVAMAAERMLLAGYLARLAAALDTDVWVAVERDDSDAHLSLTSIQQHLALHRESAPPDEGLVPVDDLAKSCDILVILGGPGAGKSWAARRVAIDAAHRALHELDAGAILEDIELPYFAACSEVLEQGGRSSRWDRLIDATLNWADDSTGDRPTLTQLLRDHPDRLVVLDGIDEVASLDDRALTALLGRRTTGTTRLVVTSRPGSWTDGLLPRGLGRHHRGELQPFSHDDTLTVVGRWLDDEPSSREGLLNHLRNPNSALSRQARVPLLCAMFCLAARPASADDGDDATDLFQPGRRIQLYDTVIDRLLRGPWRGITPTLVGGRHIDDVVADATSWLEGLADPGNLDDLPSGLSNWPDRIQPTRPLPDCAAPFIDHVAPPVRGRTGIGRRPRRFVHRSLQEHLAAKALCHQAAAPVAEQLLRHLWFDPAWIEVIPAVIAAHPDADELVERLRGHDAVAPQDPTHMLDKVLLRAAALTRPQPHRTGQRDTAIERAIQATLERTEPTQWRYQLADIVHWPALDTARHRLLGALADDDADPVDLLLPAWILAALAPTGSQAERGAQHIVDRLANGGLEPHVAGSLSGRLAELASHVGDGHDLAERIVSRLADDRLAPRAAEELARALASLAPTASQAKRGAQHIVDRLIAHDLDAVDVLHLAGVSGLSP